MAGVPPEVLQKTLNAYFAAIAVRDAQRIALVFAEDGDLEDPVGGPIRRGRKEVAAMFAAGVASLATEVKIEVLAALPCGNSIAAHWAMTARGRGAARSRPKALTWCSSMPRV